MLEFTSDTKEKYVHKMFSVIAQRYDFLNTLLSINLDKYWRQSTVALMGLRSGGHCLDVCCGTGMLSMEEARIVGTNGEVVGLDFCQPMLDVARTNISKTPYAETIDLVNGNALDLPFPSALFDAASIGFALRNVPDIQTTIAEMARVVRPGGMVVSVELCKPTLPVFRQLYFIYFNHVLPIIGRLFVGSGEPYHYLPNSLKSLPDPEEIRTIFLQNRMENAHFYKLTGGVVSIHVGTVV